MALKYVYESRQGQSYARNSGIAASKGDIILFTDDDLRFPADWLEGMCGPIIQGKAHAVAGGVKMAADLERSWMDNVHRVFLAETDTIDPNKPERMVGANMAFSREVLARVPGFDPELGPGALGFGDDTLFSSQLIVADYIVTTAFHVSVEHHFQKTRLLRPEFIKTAIKCGQTDAYLAHHWEHRTIRDARVRLLRKRLQLAAHGFSTRGRVPQEGIPVMEVCNLCSYHFYKQYLKQLAQPRKYKKHGLVKLPAVQSSAL